MSSNAQVLDFNPGAQQRPSDAKRCVAVLDNGSRCKSWASKHGLACKQHSRKLSGPQVEADRERLSHLVPISIDALRDILTSPLSEEKHRLAASKLVFDRCGITASSTLNVNRSDSPDEVVHSGPHSGRRLSELSDEEQYEQAEAFLEDLKASRKEK